MCSAHFMRENITQSALRPTDMLMLGLLVLVLLISAVYSPDNSASFSQTENPLEVETASTDTASNILPRKKPTSMPGQAFNIAASPAALPNFAAIDNVSEKKQAFFDYMLPMIRTANDKVRAKRADLLTIDAKLHSGKKLAESESALVMQLAARYRLKQDSDMSALVHALLVRVDVVPASLVLAQAANESGWGTSRFARQGNNLFGVWCFSRGCGVTPLDREQGLSHEVARYETVQQSVEAYIHTINTNWAYTELRDMRATSRETEGAFSGHALAEGLVRYSARGEDYVREIQAMIRYNNLHRFTLPVQV